MTALVPVLGKFKTMDAVEQKILAAVDAQRETLLAFAQDIGAHAEPGFLNTTARRVAELLRGAGFRRKPVWPAQRKGRFAGRRARPLRGRHRRAGRHSLPRAPRRKSRKRRCPCLRAQCAAHRAGGRRAGAERARVAEALSGSVAFFAVPAEEYVPIGTRQALQKQGVEFCCGKSELLRIGRLRRRGPCADHACTYDSLRK